MDDANGNHAPVGDVLAGLSLMRLPEGWTPLDAVAVVKCLDEAGEVRWAMRSTSGLSDEELLGALVLRTDMLRKDLLETFDE